MTPRGALRARFPPSACWQRSLSRRRRSRITASGASIARRKSKSRARSRASTSSIRTRTCTSRGRRGRQDHRDALRDACRDAVAALGLVRRDVRDRRAGDDVRPRAPRRPASCYLEDIKIGDAPKQQPQRSVGDRRPSTYRVGRGGCPSGEPNISGDWAQEQYVIAVPPGGGGGHAGAKS